jgi:hypothetical protein
MASMFNIDIGDQLRSIRATIMSEEITFDHFNTVEGRRMVARSPIRELLTLKFEGINATEARLLIECAVGLEQARNANDMDARKAEQARELRKLAAAEKRGKENLTPAEPDPKINSRFAGLDLGKMK